MNTEEKVKNPTSPSSKPDEVRPGDEGGNIPGGLRRITAHPAIGEGVRELSEGEANPSPKQE